MNDSHVFSLGPPPPRIEVSVETARTLIDTQFPQWADLEVRPVATAGWDNRTFHLGDEALMRMPSAEEYALAVPKEHRWLPLLAPHLPVTIPTPLGLGEPGAGYPFAWSVYDWVPGEPAQAGALSAPSALASDLVEFLTALRAIDPAQGPRPGVHNWFRGGSLRTYDATARDALADLAAHPESGIDVDAAQAAWQDALAALWDGVDVWFHGDLAAGNLLLDSDGRLGAVIDFGTCGVGDPACDLAIAWTLLDGAGREVFRHGLAIDDATWARGRGWALWKGLSGLAGALADQDEEWLAEVRPVVDAVLAETQP